MTKTLYEFETIDGSRIVVKVADRRRYPGCTYTYLFAECNGEDVDDRECGLASPWPCVIPGRSSVKWALRLKYDIPIESRDIRWAKKMVAENRCFVRNPADRHLFTISPKE